MRLLRLSDVPPKGAGATAPPEEGPRIAANRLKPGDRIGVFDKSNRFAEAEITSVGRETRLVILTESRIIEAAKPAVHLYLSPLKGPRFDRLIARAQELGANRIFPIICERTIARPKNEKKDRWEKIIIEAAKQSGRLPLCLIDDPQTFKVAIKSIPENGIILHEQTDDRSLVELLPGLADSETISFIVGPEGGFSDKEIKTGFDIGLITAGLGSAVLRAETAAAAALAAALYQFNR